MRAYTSNHRLTLIGLAASVLVVGGAASAQQQVNLSAGPSSAALPDGSMVPMWGYSCGAAVSGSSATCAPLNPNAGASWSPVVITVPSGQGLTVNLTNNLPVPPGATSGIPTSLVIAGQLGGGLGAPTTAPSPAHVPQGVTWSIPGDTNGATFTPPAQGPRVRSFATEVATGATTSLTWTAPRPGTYLIESGTHPSIQGPMGLYGILVVTCAPTDTTSGCTTGTAYPGVSYAADVPLLFSEIDPMQNAAVQAAVGTAGFSETAVTTLRSHVGSVVPAVDSSGNVINAGSGYLVGDAVVITGGGGNPAATAHVGTVCTAIGPGCSAIGAILTVVVDVAGNGYSSIPTASVTSAAGSGAQLSVGLAINANTLALCSDGAAACYPPAVNYTPYYYLINGVAFDKTQSVLSTFGPPPAQSVSGNVLVRLVNAGLRMHVPSIVGSATGGLSNTPGLSLIAEDGNPLPGMARVQSEVFMPAGKTMDVMINAPAAGAAALPIFDRELSLSGAAINRDAGMLAYISVNGGAAPTPSTPATAVANADTYNAVIAGRTLAVSDPSKGVIANDLNIYAVRVSTGPTQGTLTLNADGTFTYVASATWSGGDSFTYCGNGKTTGPTCTSVTLGAAAMESASGITMANSTFTSPIGPKTTAPTAPAVFHINPPGVLAYDSDGAGYPLTVDATTVSAVSPAGATVAVNVDGSFTATATAAGTYQFTYRAKNSQGTTSSSAATVTVIFPSGTGPTVTVLDGTTKDASNPITDYRWVIEEDRTFYVDPRCTTNPLPPGCPTVTSQGSPAVYGVNFHTSHMPLVATGCTGTISCESGQTVSGNPTVCDIGNGVCRTDGSASQQTPVAPSQVPLDPTKRYYISILPGDAADPFNAGYGGIPCGQPGADPNNCSIGHGMGGSPIAAGQTNVTILTQPSPYPPAKLTVFVFQDDYPLNGEYDQGGAVDVIAANEAGLGGFQITVFDVAGGTGDATGQPTYDMFNMPLTNSLAGTIDPISGLDACPISPVVTQNVLQTGPTATPAQCSADPTLKGCQKGIVGMIVTCPKYESDGKTLSPMAGTAVINNLYQGRYTVMATPGADRIARGEEWLQTNTLDGQKAHDAFIRIGEPAYFQEFGPAGYHASIGFANPKIINDRRINAGHTGMCDANGGGLSCNFEVKGFVSMARQARTPDQRLYGSGSRDAYAFTQCYVSLGDPDGADFAFTKCDPNGNFDLQGIPAGNWRLTIFDQWNDQIVDGIQQAVGLSPGSQPCPGPGTNTTVCDMGEIATHQWQANIYTRTFLDTNFNGLSDHDAAGNDLELGLALAPTNIRFRDGSYSNFNNTDLNGYAGFNEVFPLFNWYVIETDSTNYKTTGVHVVHDAGGPVDGSNPGGTACSGSSINPCGNSQIAHNLANTYDPNPLPMDLRIPGSVYCKDADCLGKSIAASAVSEAVTCTPDATAGGTNCTGVSTGRIDLPYWESYGWQGFAGQSSFLEFGKKPFATGETGGIRGHVIYASTRPFDDPQLLLQTSWMPMVPGVTVNLYKEDFAADGVTPTLKLVDTTKTSSFDDWAQGFRADGKPNISCPGQSTGDLFFYSLQHQPQLLNWYNAQHGGPPVTSLPYASQYKCYDGMHMWNQLQPAPYDGMYKFPSVTGFDPNGRPAGSNCHMATQAEPWGCVPNPTVATGDPTAPDFDPYRSGTPMLPAGKYVVEVVVPPGYELVKEEDKNILIGDNYIAPVVTQFAGLGNIFILPDQAEVAAAYNSYNAQNPTVTLGRNSSLPSHEGDTGSVETFWPCVGASRTVPDYISLFPQSAEVAPFAGATRNLCDRKEVTLTDQSSAQAKFYVFTSTHIAAHFTGIIMDDFTSEFDPFSPQFGEKFAPAFLPVSIKDWKGNEINRVYTDQFGLYNGLNYSTWEVNPPNPTGYGPTMMVMCMNDSGAGTAAFGATPDPLYQPGYSQFCYELPFMPGQTGYFDTPVTPTSAFSEGFNHPDCNYPDATPAIKSVVNSSSSLPQGPWVRPGTAATRASASFTVSGVNRCQTATCANRSTITFPGGTVSCTNTGTGGPNCSSSTSGTRNSNVAAYIRANIATLMGAGYTAGGTGASVTVNAPATGSSYNGTTVVSAVTNVTSPTPPVTLGGGLDAATAAMSITIAALGDQLVDNYAYSGPSATTPPFNQQKVNRHFGFGSTTGSVGLLGSDGCSYPLSGVTWGDLSISGTVTTSVAITAATATPACAAGTHTLPSCPVVQQAVYGGSATQCGQLVITAANGKSSVDTVTVTVGGKQPTVLAAGQTIQSAIDTAQPGDMIIVPAGVYNEIVLMWKPVRLQGVGAASAIIDSNTHPSGKLLEPWRVRINCLFGLTPDGRPRDPGDTSCSAGWTGATNASPFPTMIIDRLPFEAVMGWDATLNGNLAEQLIEPALMGAYEGASITVLGKGVSFPAGTAVADAFGATTGAAFPAGTLLLSASDCLSRGTNPYPSNFYCNPSAIDGLGVRNSSQGGGGVLVHAYAHNLQLANNRIYNNLGTGAGGIQLGMGEHPDANLGGAGATPTTDPASCETSNVTNLALPFCFNMHANVHHNWITQNSSMGDELFSATPAGGGGVTINTGADYYQFTNNWVCGNMSSGDGGGFAHIGLIKNGDIEHNVFIFNQSFNPTITTNGGGLLVMGAPDADPVCGATNDKDCVVDPAAVTPSDGTGLALTINANLILGNAAESGSGGGLRLQAVNGNDVVNFPNGASSCATPGTCLWNSVNVTNNIIANNVAGWDGGGLSLLDALAVNVVNNTIVSNDSTATAGVLFGSLFAPLASAPGTNCTQNNGSTSCPQVAGVVSLTNSPVLMSNLPATGLSCPPGHGTSGSCRYYSVPLLYNDVIWQNRSFYLGVGDFGTGLGNQQKLVTLYDAFTTTQAPVQSNTGDCGAASYWEVGVRGDPRPANHGVFLDTVRGTTTNLVLSPNYSVLTDAADYPGANNLASNPKLVSQYCNGSRTPPEAGVAGYVVNPGTNETNALPHPVFSLTPTATVDEGNNWINMRWGPLSLTNAARQPGQTGYNVPLGNYGLQPGSPAIDYIPFSSSATSAYALAPSTDFFGKPRKTGTGTSTNWVDVGAVELVAAGSGAHPQLIGGPLAFGNQGIGGASPAMTLTLDNSTAANLAGIAVVVTAPFSRATAAQGGAGTCGTTLTAGETCTINIVFTPTGTTPATGTATVTAGGGVTITGSPASLTGTGVHGTATVSPAALAFGSWPTVPLPSELIPKTVTVTNTSAFTLFGGTYTLGGNASQFTHDLGTGAGTCGATLAAGASCTYNVAFNPQTLGSKTATLTVAFTGATVTGGPVTLTGTGVNMAVVETSLASGDVATGAPLAFGNVATGSTATQTLLVRNSTGGTRSLALSGLAAPFSRPAGAAGGTCGASLGNGSSCTIAIQFAPTATGARSGSLAIATTPPPPGGFTVSNSPVGLTGTGVAPVVSASLAPTTWSPTGTLGCGNGCPVQQFTLSNTGNVSLTGIAPSVAGASEFVIVSSLTTCTATLAAGASCFVGVQFSVPPDDSRGPKSGTLSVTDSAGTQTSALTGTVN